MAAKVVSQEEWLAKRKELLQKEKELTRAYDSLNAQLRDLGMVKITKPYTFTGSDSDSEQLQLSDLFDGRRQLIVYHFMFAPESTEGCIGCSFVGDHIPNHLSHLNSKDTTFAAVSRAPIEKIEAFKQRMGWTFPWYSSFGTDFNYDFQATQDESVRPIEYNYEDKASLERKGKMEFLKGDTPGFSVFFHQDGEVYHSYSTYARGLERFLVTCSLLDMTLLGKPKGLAGAGEFRYHDRYESSDVGGK